MAKLEKVAGATSEIWQVFIQDSSSTTGAGLTGLAFNTASLTAYYHRDTDTTATAITLVTMTVGTFTSSGFKEIDATNQPGLYQFCPPNAAIASGAKSCAFVLKGATNMAPLPIEVQLTAVNPDSATAFVTSVNVGSINSVSTSSVTTVSANQGTTQPLNFTGAAGSALVKSDMVDVAGSAVSTTTAQLGVNAVQINAVATTSVTTISANVGTTQPVNFTGTGASALAKSDMVDIAGAAVSTSTAQLGVNVVNFGGSVGTFASGRPEVNTTHLRGTASVGAVGYVGLDWSAINAPTTAQGLTGTTIATSQVVASVTGAVGSVTGAVGSVAGAVGSVAGNVGGNVVGSVGSVAAAVTVGTNNDKTGYRIDATGSAALTESYAADGAAATLPQLLYGVKALLGEFSISGTTLTTKKLDGATSAEVYTLNDATSPTSITRTG